MVEYHELDDRQLIQQTALDAEEAMEELYNRYSTTWLSLAWFTIRHDSPTEKASQKKFLKIWLKCASYNGKRERPKSWIREKVLRSKIPDSDYPRQPYNPPAL